MDVKTPEHMKTRKRQILLPRVGMRMIKTAIAVFICLLIHILRGYTGPVIHSCVAAIICMQPYAEDTKRTGINRFISTVIGGVGGLLFLLLMDALPGISSYMVLVYTLMSLGVLIVLYLCVVLNVAASATLASIVYLIIIYNYPDVGEPLSIVVNRLLDTLIGILVAMAVNSFHLPVTKHTEKVFFLHLKDIAADRYAKIPSRVLIELNRLYDAGAKICLETRWAPAFMISQMSAVRISMPIIVMDGAGLYDMRENLFYELMRIPNKDADFLREKLRSLGYCVCILAVRTHSMLIFHDGPLSEGEQWDLDIMRKAPYRNYMDGMYEDDDQVAALRILVKTEDADGEYEKISRLPGLSGRFRVRVVPMAKGGDWTGIYFYRHDSSIEKMEQKMIEHVQKESGGAMAAPVHVFPPSGNYDPEYDAPLLLKQIASEYMDFHLM